MRAIVADKFGRDLFKLISNFRFLIYHANYCSKGNRHKGGMHPLGDKYYNTAELADHSLLRGQWSTEVSAFVAGHCGSQLTLPWIDDEEYWNTANSSQRYSYSATTARANALILPDLSPISSPSESLIDTIAPHALSAKARGNSEDNPTWSEAMSGENAADYYNAAIEELITLQEKLHCWKLVRYESTMNVLPSTWAFKCKRYPDGRIKKFKARFCARGDRQKEGIDYFETWSPVVQWQTVRLMIYSPPSSASNQHKPTSPLPLFTLTFRKQSTSPNLKALSIQIRMIQIPSMF